MAQTSSSLQSKTLSIDIEKLSQASVTNLDFDLANLDELSKRVKTPTNDSSQDINKLLELQKQMSEMLLARFAANMDAFRKYLPNIYEQFNNYQPSEELEFICTENGIPNLYYPQKDSFFYKSYDPVKLCQMQVDLFLRYGKVTQAYFEPSSDSHGQLSYRYTTEAYNDALEECLKFSSQHPLNSTSYLTDKHSTPIAILLGIGLGYHIGYFYEQVEVGNLIVIEPNKDLFFASLHTFDWANLLDFIVTNNRGIYLMVGQSEEEVIYDLQMYYQHHGGLLAYIFCVMTHYRAPLIDKIEQTLKDCYQNGYNSLGFIDDSFFALSHAIKNLQHKIPFAKKDLSLTEQFLNTPVCVVANGPSLSKDLAVLRKIQDKVIIMACGTALETLYITGVKPDVYICTERARNVEAHLEFVHDKNFLKNCLCFALDINHPSLFTFFDKSLIFLKKDEIFAQMLYRSHPQQFLQVTSLNYVNPLVGNFGVSVALSLGFKNIYLFGLDNGTKRTDGLTHADENEFYKQKYLKELYRINTQNASCLEGNFGGKVFTTPTYQDSIYYIEAALELNTKSSSDIRVFNCSDGAKLKNTFPLHSESLLERYQNTSDAPKLEFIEFMLNQKAYQLELNEEDVESLICKKEIESIFDQLIKIIDKRDLDKFNTRAEYALFLQYMNEVLFSRAQSPILRTLLYGSMSMLNCVMLWLLYKVDDEPLAIKLTDNKLKYLKYLLEDSKKAYELIPEYCMIDHLTHFEKGKLGFDHEDSPAPAFTPFSFKDNKQLSVEKFVKRYI